MPLAPRVTLFTKPLFLCFSSPHLPLFLGRFQVTHRTCPATRKCDHPVPFSEVTHLPLFSISFYFSSISTWPLTWFMLPPFFFFFWLRWTFSFESCSLLHFCPRTVGVPWHFSPDSAFSLLLILPWIGYLAHPTWVPCKPNVDNTNENNNSSKTSMLVWHCGTCCDCLLVVLQILSSWEQSC